MSTYLPFFNIAVSHDFFVDGTCPCLVFEPTSATQRTIKNAGLLLKKTRSGIALSYSQDRLDALQLFAEDANDPLAFEFKVYAADPAFRSYTEPYSEDSGEILYFENNNDPLQEDDTIRLHESEYVSKINLIELNADQLKDILSQRDRLVPPVIAIKIIAGSAKGMLFDDNGQPQAQTYCIKFVARQTFWKYYLLGGGVKGRPFIFDADQEVEFESTGETVLPDNRIAQTFRSKQRLPLAEKSQLRFQLRENGHGGEKIIIKRLPVARASQTGKDVVAEHGMLVSEIYINY